MKSGDLVKAVGYQHPKERSWPFWLLSGNHRISKVKLTGFGLLVQTDRQPMWMNRQWFAKMTKTPLFSPTSQN